jgi:hypothetical protein
MRPFMWPFEIIVIEMAFLALVLWAAHPALSRYSRDQIQVKIKTCTPSSSETLPRTNPPYISGA